MSAVYKREVKALFKSVYGWLFGTILLLATGYVMFKINFLLAYPDFSYNLIQWGEYAVIVMIPLLCMRCVTYDKKHGTDQLFFALPLRTSTVVLGKFFALLTVLAVPMAILSLYPLLLRSFGQVNLLSAYSSLVMFFLMCAALFALCMFISSLTKYMTVAAIIGFFCCALLYLLQYLVLLLPYTALASYVGMGVLAILLTVAAWFSTKSALATALVATLTVLPLTVFYLLDEFVCHWEVFESVLTLVLSHISVFKQYRNGITGECFDLFSVVLLLAFTTFFLLLTVQSMNRRRQN